MICMATAFAYCLLFIGLLSAFAEPLCWLCIVVIQLGLIGLPCLFGYKFYTIKQALNAPIPAGGLPHSPEYIEQEEAQATFYIMGAIGFSVLCCCFAGCLWCCYSSIKKAIDVIDASADFVMCTKRILLVPFIYFLMSMLVVIAWFVGYLMVMSINPISASTHIW